MARSIVDEILGSKDRVNGQSAFHFGFEYEVDRVAAFLTHAGKPDRFHIEFAVTRLVTIIEVFLRGAIRVLVDHGAPYLERAADLTKNAKVDLRLLELIQRQDISAGDFVAHIAPTSNLEAALGVLDKLMGDFASKLKRAHPRWTEEIDTWPLPPIISDFDRTMAALFQLFGARNIVTHELPSDSPASAEDLARYLSASRLFVEAASWIIIECIQVPSARTQLQMNMDAGSHLEAAQTRLESALDRLVGVTSIDADDVRNVQALWKVFAKAQAKLSASIVMGGSMYPMIYASAMSELIKTRIDSIESEIAEWANT